MIHYKNFNIYSDGDNLVVLNTNTKELKSKVVQDDHEFTFKVMKTKIKAIGGIDGLIKFIEQCVNENFGTCWVNNIIERM